MSDTNVHIVIPEEFLDVMDNPWSTGAGQPSLGLKEVLLLTVRRCPVKNGEGAERTLNLIEAIKPANGHIELRKNDYDWMIAHFKEMAFNVWSPPDAAYLVRYLQAAKTTTAHDD